MDFVNFQAVFFNKGFCGGKCQNKKLTAFFLARDFAGG
jgi:hypothetical protein